MKNTENNNSLSEMLKNDSKFITEMLKKNPIVNDQQDISFVNSYEQSGKNMFKQRKENPEWKKTIIYPKNSSQTHFSLTHLNEIKQKQDSSKNISIIQNEQARLQRIQQAKAQDILTQNKLKSNVNQQIGAFQKTHKKDQNINQEMRNQIYHQQQKIKQQLNQNQTSQFSEERNQKEKEKIIQAKILLEDQKRKEYQTQMKQTLKTLSFNLPNPQKIEQNLLETIIKKPVTFNSNSLLKFLLTCDFQQKLPSSYESIPHEFSSFTQYRQSFQFFYERECFYQLKQKLDRFGPEHKIFFGQFGFFQTNATEYQDEFVYFELKEKKSSTYDSNLFDLLISKNYLVFLSSSPDLDLSLLKDKTYREKQFLILGYIFCNDGQRQSPKIKACVDVNYFSKFFKKQNWVDVYIHPVEKITTQMREYQSILNLENTELSNSILNPLRSVKDIHFNADTLESFFGYLRKTCNKSQYLAVKQICSQQEGVMLLQGPPGTGKTFTLLQIVSGIYNTLKLAKTHKRQIMICAPSNAAIDEIILRLLKDGLVDSDGNRQMPKLVRVGVLDHTENQDIHSVSLENQANAKFSTSTSDISETKGQILKITEQIGKSQNSPNIQILYDKRRALIEEYQKWKLAKINEKEKFQDILKSILFESEIICTTLGSSGSEKLALLKNQIDTLIIDESTQSCEPQILIPLQYNMKKMVLIGDPKQLPATTFSPDVNITKYDRSLFERLVMNGMKPHFLDIQYRMHENIRAFPSYKFYDNKLVDSNKVQERSFPKDLYFMKKNNVLFLDLPYTQESMRNRSYFNEQEAQVVKKLVSYFSFPEKIGIISPYKAQVNLLKSDLNNIQINSIDSFQGQEKDIIILSTVRSNQNARNQIGFLYDQRRMNVAITRAKHVLIILGNANTLSKDPLWDDFIKFHYNRNWFASAKNEQEVTSIFNHLNEEYDIPKFYRKLTLQGNMIKQSQNKVEEFKTEKKEELIGDEEERKIKKVKTVKQNDENDSNQGLFRLISKTNQLKTEQTQGNKNFITALLDL